MWLFEYIFACFYTFLFYKLSLKIKSFFSDFPGGAVVKNPPANARDTGSSSGPGRLHMPLSPCATTTEPEF